MNNLEIGIIGGGAMGSALSAVLAEDAGLKPRVWDKNPKKSNIDSLQALASSSEVVFICAPSWANRQIAKGISSALSKSAGERKLVVSLAKGVEQGFVTMDEVLAGELGEAHDIGVFYGPMLAEEIVGGHSGYGVLAVSSSSQLPERIVGVLEGSRLKVKLSQQPRAVAVAGVLKNIYALILGICDGANMGANTKSILTGKILDEMKIAAKKLGGQPDVVDDWPGLADLLATGWSGESFNYHIGEAIAKQMLKEGLDSEGLNSLQQLVGKLDINQLPLAAALNKLVNKKLNVEDFKEFIESA